MSAKRSRAWRSGWEALERRETPSAHAAAAAAPVVPKVLPFNTSGTAFVVLSKPVINGQEVMTLIPGKSTTLGSYTVLLDIIYGVSNGRGTGTGTITSSNGSQVNLSLTSHIQIPTRIHGNGGSIQFKVTGGTQAFSGATGSGTLTGNVNYLYPFTFHTHGRIVR